MSGTMMGIVELLLVFGVVFGWGFYELRSLRKYREQDEAEKARRDQSREEQIRQEPDSADRQA